MGGSNSEVNAAIFLNGEGGGIFEPIRAGFLCCGSSAWGSSAIRGDTSRPFLWPAAATSLWRIPMENPYCSCKRVHLRPLLRPPAGGAGPPGWAPSAPARAPEVIRAIAPEDSLYLYNLM